MPSTRNAQAEADTQELSDTPGPTLRRNFLTMISSSRSGDSTRGMITWFRNSGVFSCFSTLFKVFSCPESNAKLSRTEGLGKRMKKAEHGKGCHRWLLSLLYSNGREVRKYHYYSSNQSIPDSKQ